jgi:hypothetical protein
MAFVMEIKSEVFGRCVEEIEVSVEVKNGDLLLCYECKYLRFIWAAKAAKAAQNQRWRWVMVPGIGWHFGRFGSY